MRCLLNLESFTPDVETSFGQPQEGHGHSCRLCALVRNSHTLTFGVERRNHIVSTAIETVAKTKKTETRKARCPKCDQYFFMNGQAHNRCASVLASMRWLLRGGKRDVTCMTVPQFFLTI